MNATSASMKKSKKHKGNSGGFKNNTFESLKDLKTAAYPSEKTKITASARKDKSDDDASLFLVAVQGTRAMSPQSENQLDAMKYKADKHRQEADKDEQRLFLQAVQEINLTFQGELPKTDTDEPRRGSAGRRLRQLKRGAIVLSDELDLHGYVKDEALKRLEQFIVGAYRRGQRAVLVITGKGTNSAGGPVLQGAVAKWLRENGKAMVAEFAPAPRDKGGSGAFAVFLKSK